MNRALEHLLKQVKIDPNIVEDLSELHDQTSISQSRNYIIQTKDSKLFLKGYSESGFFKNEMHAYDVLKENNLFESVSGSLLHYGINSRGPYALFNYIEGTSLNNLNLDLKMFEEFSKYYHKALSNYPVRKNLQPLMSDGTSWLTNDLHSPQDLFLKSCTRITRRLKESSKISINQEKEYFIRFKKVSEKIRHHSFILCHGDLTPRNIIRTKRSFKLIDWEYSYWGPIEKDLGDYAYSFASQSGLDYKILVNHIKKDFDKNVHIHNLYSYLLPQALTIAYTNSRKECSLAKELNDIEEILKIILSHST